MRQTDIQIVEHLYNGGDELVEAPQDIAVNIDLAEGNVRQRLPPLREAGLVEFYDVAVSQYQLADLGRKYIEGVLSDNEIEAIESELMA